MGDGLAGVGHGADGGLLGPGGRGGEHVRPEDGAGHPAQQRGGQPRTEPGEAETSGAPTHGREDQAEQAHGPPGDQAEAGDSGAQPEQAHELGRGGALAGLQQGGGADEQGRRRQGQDHQAHRVHGVHPVTVRPVAVRLRECCPAPAGRFGDALHGVPSCASRRCDPRDLTGVDGHSELQGMDGCQQ